MKEIKTDDRIFELLKKSKALMSGHFILSSGLHSDKYVQCAKFFQYPEYTRIASEKLKEKFGNVKPDVVIGGAFGGITIAYGLAEVYNVRGIFAERVDGIFELRRGFDIQPGEKVLIAEDVITTGKSIKEVIELVKEYQGEIIGIASLIDRHREEPEQIPYRIEWLHSIVADAWAADKLPSHLEGTEAVKPGSRGTK